MTDEIRVVTVGGVRSRLVRPGARYVAVGVAAGVWLPVGKPLPVANADVFTPREAALLLPLLRTVDQRVAGRLRTEATSPDGKLIDTVCQALAIDARVLAARLGVHESTLARARSLTGRRLPPKHRIAIAAMLGASLSTGLAPRDVPPSRP